MPDPQTETCRLRPQLLVATPSEYRRDWYVTELPGRGFDVETVTNGTDCIEHLRVRHPDVLLLESGLQSGGADGVLAARSRDAQLHRIPVVLIAIRGVSTDVYQLARFPVQAFFGRLPTGSELAASLHLSVREMNAPDTLPVAGKNRFPIGCSSSTCHELD